MAKELKPWYAVATPHEDIQKGRLSEAVFAANLWAVVQGTAPDVYTDPDAFFNKTYLTGGLSRVLKKAAEAITGSAEAGDRIMSLQTAFGGGKTHALVALWHLAHNNEKIRRSAACADLRKLLGDSLPKKVNALAVFTNQTCDATQGRKTSQGIRTHTMWGELAVQLGGKALYEEIRLNDERQTAPKGLFVEILKKAAPCLILLDEVADYCVAASAVKVHDSTLADQTISFLQELTESAQQVQGVAVVATLPASHIEVASSEKGEEILKRLEKRVGRMAADNTPVADNEIYEVVRRRLFESLGDPKDHEAAAEAYMQMYQQHRNELPTEATRASYKENIVAAFPFHPSLIDALYLRWGSHGDFQRTRGVLRLLASVVADLWKRRKNETQTQALIQPCHIRWTIEAMHAALTRLWGAQYESVVANDVIGDKANAVLLDEERGQEYVRERIVEGLAAATMLGSFGGQGERAGYSTKDLKLCVGRPGLNWGYTDGALLALEERGFFLHTAPAGNLGRRYWFGTKPTLNKLVVQYRNQYSSKDVDPEIIEALQKEVRDLRPGPASWRVLVNPEADLPEQKSLTLVVMPPSSAYSEESSQPSLVASPPEEAVMRLSQKCGKKDRHYRNTLLFLLPSPRGLGRLRNALREVQALESVKQDYGSQLDDDQRNDLNGRLTTARKSVTESLGSAYTYAAQIEGQKLAISQITDTRASFGEHLGLIWKHLVEDEEWILRKVGTVTLQKVNLIPETEGIRLKEAVETFLRHTDKPMISSRHAVVEGLSQACKERLLGIGRGLKLDSLQRKWCGDYVNIDPDEEGLWIIPPFSPEATPTTTGGGPGVGTEPKPGTQPPTTTGGGTVQQPPEKPGPVAHPVKKIKVSGSVPIESWHELFRCFVKPSADLKPKKLKLGVDFELAFEDAQGVNADSPAIRGMKEAARQLGLEIVLQPEDSYAMSLSLHEKCIERLTEVATENLRQIIVIHGNLLDYRSTLGLRVADSVLPQSGPVKEALVEYISDTPIYDFICQSISKELLECEPSGIENQPRPLTSFAAYADPVAAAQRLIHDLESLPWEYSVLMKLDSDFGKLASQTVKRYSICNSITIITPDAEFAGEFPTRSGVPRRDEALAPSIPLPFWFGLPPPLPAKWDQSCAWLQMQVSGFVGRYLETSPIQDAIATLKAVLGMGIGLGLLGPRFGYHWVPAMAQLVIHRRQASHWVIEGTHALDPSLSSAIGDITLSESAQKDPASALEQTLRSIGHVFQQKEKCQRLLLACQWVFDSYGATNELLSFVQAAVAIEILLGDKASSDLMGLGELLRNRCAYLIGTSHRDREEILMTFKQIYDVRCEIVHSGKRRLDSAERGLFAQLQWICARVIKEEVRLLEIDFYIHPDRQRSINSTQPEKE